MLLVSSNPFDYHFCSQGVTTVDHMDDGDELLATDVSVACWLQIPAVPFSSTNDFTLNLEDHTRRTYPFILSSMQWTPLVLLLKRNTAATR